MVSYLTYRLLRPINELISNSKLVRRGNFGVRNKIIPNDELGLLSSNFNFMLEKIQNSIKGLENEVQIRTKELERKVYYDSLTNTLNREAYFRDTKSEESLTVILIDINKFDDINDLYGFDVGNAVLKEVSLKFHSFAKENNFTLYKIYGDVFALVSSEYLFSLYHLERIVEKINLIFNLENIKLTKYNLELNLSISLGISIAQENPLKSAGIALRKAKESDRNFFVYSNELDTKEQIKETKYWENRIKKALQKDEIVPYFQAIFNKEKQVVKYEALMRIIDSETKNEISPAKFMNYAKQSKQYIDINLNMIKKVLQKIDKTEDQISLNISFKAIQNKIFDNELYKLLEGLSSKSCTKIIFEILESEFVKDYEIYESFINKYKRLGIEVAIDDFGSGYSNFKQILKIKPDYLKFDGSIIKDIDKNPESFQLVKHTVKFAKSVDIKTIAEFVHSEKVYNTLISLGIDEFQGFYLAKPEKDFINK